jgi:hypothetical protein
MKFYVYTDVPPTHTQRCPTQLCHIQLFHTQHFYTQHCHIQLFHTQHFYTNLHTHAHTRNTVTKSSFTQPVLLHLLSFLPFPSHFHICLMIMGRSWHVGFSGPLIFGVCVCLKWRIWCKGQKNIRNMGCWVPYFRRNPFAHMNMLFQKANVDKAVTSGR